MFSSFDKLFSDVLTEQYLDIQNKFYDYIKTGVFPNIGGVHNVASLKEFLRLNLTQEQRKYLAGQFKIKYTDWGGGNSGCSALAIIPRATLEGAVIGTAAAMASYAINQDAASALCNGVSAGCLWGFSRFGFRLIAENSTFKAYRDRFKPFREFLTDEHQNRLVGQGRSF